MDLNENQSESFSNSNDRVIVGEWGKNFTIYCKSRSIKKNNLSVFVDFAYIYSGTYENGSIRNLKHGFVCVDDTHNDGTYVKKGTARVFVDKDLISEPTTWSLAPGMKIKGTENNKPDRTQAK